MEGDRVYFQVQFGPSMDPTSFSPAASNKLEVAQLFCGRNAPVAPIPSLLGRAD